MLGVNTQTQDLQLKYYCNSKHCLESHRMTDDDKPDRERHIKSQTKKPSASSEKPPSKLGLLFLAVVAIALYGLGIDEVSKTVTNIVEAAVQETLQDYRF